MISLEELRNGKIFIINKPLDWTSFQVVNKIRWNIRKAHGLKKFKVGHAGTLDPRATGVLIICVGKFTKRISEFQNQSKTYTGVIKLGATTASYDTEQPEEKLFPTAHITADMIQKATQQFIGDIQQIPPIHSAVKKDGKRLYERARAGEVFVPEKRAVHISDFEITHIDMPYVSFRVDCSKGTYIRSLANDFGAALDSGGYLVELTRTRSGEFTLEDADNGPLEKEYFL